MILIDGWRTIMETKKSITSQQGLDRMLDLLEILEKNDARLNISEISRELNITRATASNMVQTLLSRGYIERDSSGKLSLGYKIYELGQTYRYRYTFLYVAQEPIIAAAERLKIKVNVCVLKSSMVAVLVMSKDVSLLPKMILGYSMPAYASASGKLLLANLPPAALEEELNSVEFVRYTAKTITDKAVLRAQLDEILSAGIAYEYEELMMQHCCVAAPIHDMSGQVIASVSFATDYERIMREKQTLTDNIVLLADTISSLLGYNPWKKYV